MTLLGSGLKRPAQASAAQASHSRMLQQQYLQQAALAQAMSGQHYWPTQTASTGTGASYVAYTNNGVAYAAQAGTNPAFWQNSVQTAIFDDFTVDLGTQLTVRLPDGSRLSVESDGSYSIDDSDAKVTYRAASRDFNSFINASDKLESFIEFCGSLNVKQDEMLNIPIKHFIAWLVIEAARADGETPEANLLENLERELVTT